MGEINMFCVKCGEKLKEDAKFCSSCGKSVDEECSNENVSTGGVLSSNFLKKFDSKKIIAIVGIIVVLVVLVSALPNSKKSSIVGSWENYNGFEVSFSENGEFTYGTNHYGTYTIYDDNQLVLTYKDFDWLTEQDKYEWEVDWYVDGNTLTLDEKVFYRK